MSLNIMVNKGYSLIQKYLKMGYPPFQQLCLLTALYSEGLSGKSQIKQETPTKQLPSGQIPQ